MDQSALLLLFQRFDFDQSSIKLNQSSIFQRCNVVNVRQILFNKRAHPRNQEIIKLRILGVYQDAHEVS